MSLASKFCVLSVEYLNNDNFIQVLDVERLKRNGSAVVLHTAQPDELAENLNGIEFVVIRCCFGGDRLNYDRNSCLNKD